MRKIIEMLGGNGLLHLMVTIGVVVLLAFVPMTVFLAIPYIVMKLLTDWLTLPSEKPSAWLVPLWILVLVVWTIIVGIIWSATSSMLERIKALRDRK